MCVLTCSTRVAIQISVWENKPLNPNVRVIQPTRILGKVIVLGGELKIVCKPLTSAQGDQSKNRISL